MYILNQSQTNNYNKNLINNCKFSLKALYKYLIVFYVLKSN